MRVLREGATRRKHSDAANTRMDGAGRAAGRAAERGRSLDAVATRFVIIGGGPAGNTAATYAQRFGADVTMIERDVIGGAAHLWDCIPSKTMIATGGAMAFLRRSTGMGLEQAVAEVDTDALAARIEGIKEHLREGVDHAARQPGRAACSAARARFVGPYEVEVTGVEGTQRVPFDAALDRHRVAPAHPGVVRARR